MKNAKTTEKRFDLPLPKNAYALPDGTILGLPEHCTEPAERFQLKGGAMVIAIRVQGDDDHGAWKMARAVHACR